MLGKRRIWGGWTAVLVVAVLLVIGCGGGGGGGGDNGSPTTYSISGTVTSGGAALPGVTVALTGAASASTTTDASGHYRFAGLSGGTYTITPSIPGYGFTPANQQETISSADITGVDFSATPNTARAWGRNVDGQLGDGSTTQRNAPVQVRDSGGLQYLTEVVAVSCGWSHTLALRADGTVWAWGSGLSGQLGDGQGTDSALPVQVSNLSGVVAIAAGNLHSLAILSNRTVWAWGWNGNGQLGDGSTTQRNAPVQVSNLNNVVAIAAGNFYSLALRTDGTVWGWGDNGYGQLGVNPSITPESNVPVQASGLTNMTAIACGYRHSIAIRSDGTVWAWGDNSYGQLGRDTGGLASSTPAQVMSISDVAAIAGGEYHTIAAKSDGTVWTWGLNDNGQLGIGPSPPQSDDAVQVTGLSGVVAVAAGSYHSVILGSDGTVWTWGQNFDGQLGDGGTTQRNAPFQVPGLINIDKIAAGQSHTAAVKSP